MIVDMIMRRLLVIITLIAALASFCACDKQDVIDNPNPVDVIDDSDKVVMSYEGEELTSGMYAFIFSYIKPMCLYYLQGASDSDFVEDTSAFWGTATDDGTYGEIAVRMINEHCMMTLICKDLAKEHGVSVTSDGLDSAEDELNDLIASYGSKDKFTSYLRRYGIDIDDVSSYIESRYLITALQDALCAEGGHCEVAEDDVYAYIEENYRKVNHIFLDNIEYDGDATAKGAEILSELDGGAVFKDYVSVSDDSTAKTYENGVVINLNEVNENYGQAASSVEVGKYAMCSTEYGVYIVVGCKMTDDDIKGEYESVRGLLADERFLGYMDELYGFVELDSKELGKYNIVTADCIE